MKVEQLAGYVAAEGYYHHGADSLKGAIVNMAQDFIGSNNMPWLYPSGNFGSRRKSGDDHGAPRYIDTRIGNLTPFFVRKEDDPILDYVYEDGNRAEPIVYHPIVPMALVNGVQGIGTGYSTTLPPFNPRDIISNIRRVLKGEDVVPMVPYLVGYTGTIKRISDGKKGFKYVSKGKYSIKSNKTLLIKELPYSPKPSKCTVPIRYKEHLNTMMAENPKKPLKKDLLESIKDESNNNKVYFELDFIGNKLIALHKEKKITKKFGLEATFTINNIKLFDENYKIKKFENPEEVLEHFCNYRIKIYQKRFDYYLEQLKYEKIKLESQAKFIKAKLDKKIIIENKTKDDVIDKIENKLKLPKLGPAWNSEESQKNYTYLTDMKIFSLTKEKVTELLEKVKQKQKEYDEYLKKTPKKLWLEELDELEQEFIKYEEELIENYADSKKAKETGKKKNRKVKTK